MKVVGDWPKGLTEFTNSESKLERLVALSSMTADGPKSLEVLARRAERELGLSSLDVVGRHVRLAERLGLIQRSGPLLHATDAARGLRALDTKQPTRAMPLSPYDRLALTQWLFREADYQLMALVDVISRNEDSHPASVIVAYFSSTPNLPWPKEGIERNIRVFKASGRTPRLWEHKVTAMVSWLRALGLLTPSGVYALTGGGRRALKLWQSGREAFRRKPLTVAALSTGLILADVGPRQSLPPSLVKEVTEMILSSRGPLGMISYEFVSLVSSLSLVVEHGVVLEADEFYQVVKDLWKDGILRSILMGRDGRPTAISIGSDS